MQQFFVPYFVKCFNNVQVHSRAKLLFAKIVCYFVSYSMDLFGSRVLLPKADLVRRYFIFLF